MVRNDANSQEGASSASAVNVPSEDRSDLPPQSASTAFVAAVVVCGAGIVAYSVIDLVTRPISYEWLMLLALTVASDLGNPARSWDAHQLLDLRHLQHRIRAGVRPGRRRGDRGA